MHDSSAPNQNVVNLFTRETLADRARYRIIRILPEHHHTRMLYSSARRPDRLIAVPLLCWGLRVDGEIVGLVPWLNEVTDCTRINSIGDVSFEGYYREDGEQLFFDAPEPVVAQLRASARFAGITAPRPVNYPDGENNCIRVVNIVHELPDQVGTHALIVSHASDSLTLTPVLSWGLDDRGKLHGLLIDENRVRQSPVVPGDDCLFSAEQEPDFRCFFQRDIAHQIQVQNPETLAAIEHMLSL